MRPSIVRGSTVVLTVEFADESGNPISPASATLHLNYINGGGRVEEEVELVESSDVWSAEWDSTPASPGRVHWSVRSVSPSTAEDGDFDLTANLANPDDESL
jgi:hypothetical protein